MSLLLWKPAGTATPAAPVTGWNPPDVPTLHARIAWRPEDITGSYGFTALPWDGSSTSGWVTDGTASAGYVSSLATTSSDSFGGGSSYAMTTTAYDMSGIAYPLTGTFTSGREYRLRVGIRRLSGDTQARIRFGSFTNLLTNGDFDSDLSSWTVGDATSSTWQSGLGPDGSGCLRTIGDGSGQEQVFQTVDAVEGDVLRASAFIWADAADTANIQIQWLDSGLSLISATTAADNDSTLSTWLLAETSGTAPATTAKARVRLTIPSNSTDTARFDNVKLHKQDEGDETVTLTSGWAGYTCDWTPSADITDACVAISNASAAALTCRIDHVEVYEKLDEVALDSLTVTRGSSFDGGREPPGRIDFGVLDPTDLYTPRNTSSALYGSVEPQRKVHIRATYGGRLYPIAYGTLRSISPDPDTRTVRFSADDGLAELDGYSISRPFAVTGSYRAARAAALSDEALGTAQHSLATDSIEADTMIDGTDAAVGLLGYLDGLNEATGTVHYCKPHVEAVRPWRYTTITRASQTESLTGTVIDEDFQRLAAADLRDEAYVTRQRVGWRGYEVLDSQVVVQATAEKPYWTYTDEQYGSSEEPEIEGVYIVKWKRGNKKKRRWKRKKIGNRWVDAQVPIEFVNGQTVERIIDFDVPMEDVSVAVTDGGNVTTTSTIEPARITISMTASATDTVTDIVVTAKPRIPLDDQEEVVTTSGATVIREGNPIDSEHTASGGQATGLATYRTWRYGAGRMRPSVTDQHQPARQLTIDIGSHLTLSADRWFIAAVPCVVRSLRHEVSAKGLEWETTYGVEEVEAGNTWVTLGGGASRGIGSSAALAY